MARNPRHLTGWQVVAVIVFAALILPMAAGYHWLEANRPRAALALFLAGRACFVGLVGLLAWNLWGMAIIIRDQHRDRASRPFRAWVQTTLRAPLLVYFACACTAVAVFGTIQLVREAIRRAS